MPATAIAGTRSGLESLSEAALTFARASRAPATLDGYRRDWVRFDQWCRDRHLSPMPAAPSVVCDYLVDLSERYAAATISRAVASISVAHQTAGYDPPTRSSEVRAVLTGIRRSLGTAPRQVNAATIGEVRRMVARLDLDHLQGLRDRALILVGFATAARRSELVSYNVEDITPCEEGLRLALRRSKTDQESHGAERAVPFGRDHETCPVRALETWMSEAGIDEGPLFRSIDRHGNVSASRLSSQSVALVVKRAAAAVGLDESKYSGHSLRAGFVTTAAAAGRSEREISAQTGHSPSSAVLRSYIRHANLFTENAASHLGL